MKRVGTCVLVFAIAIVGITLCDPGHAEEPSPAVARPSPDGPLRNLFFRRRSVSYYETASSLLQSSIAINCPNDGTTRPLTFTANGTGPDAGDIYGTLLNEEFYILPGTTTDGPKNWKIDFDATSNPPSANVWLRVELLDPFEFVDSASTFPLQENGTPCDAWYETALGNRPAAQAGAKRVRAQQHLTMSLPPVHNESDFIIATVSPGPSAKAVYGIIMADTPAGRKKPFAAAGKLVDVPDNNGKTKKAWQVNFGKKKADNYIVRARSVSKGKGKDAEVVDGATEVRKKQ